MLSHEVVLESQPYGSANLMQPPPGVVYGRVDVHADLHRIESAFMTHSSECSQQLLAARDDLARLQGLINDAMSRMTEAFGKLDASALERDSEASGQVVSSLQFQDICSQLVAHLNDRLGQTGALLNGLSLPFSAAMAATRGDRETVRSVAVRVNDLNQALAAARRHGERCPVGAMDQDVGEVELF